MGKLLKRGAAVVASLLGVTLLGSVFAPSLCRSRESANRVKCASNLKQIGQAVLLYADAHRGELPDSIATLGRSEDLVTEVFCCPSSNAEKAASWDALAADGSAKVLSYQYVGDGLNSSQLTEHVVVALDLLDNHDSDGVNVLLGDGHVEFFPYTRRKPPAWYTHVRQQIDAGTRPVRIDGAK
jgi:prepilin-type processing-associated H-X9-DG protein